MLFSFLKNKQASTRGFTPTPTLVQTLLPYFKSKVSSFFGSFHLYINSKVGVSLQSKRGFTLIEVMVAVSIFAIVVTVGVGSLMTVNKAYRQSQAQRAAIDNISFALEAMTREIRVGQAYNCGTNIVPATTRTDCSAPSFSFTSFNADNDDLNNNVGAPYELGDDDVTYSLVTQIGQPGKITVQVGTSNPPTDLTSDDVNVTGLEFVLREQNQQPYVAIHIAAEATNAQQISPIVMQTSVSQRLLLLLP